MVRTKASSPSRPMIYLNDDLFRRVEQEKYRMEEEKSRSRTGRHHGRLDNEDDDGDGHPFHSSPLSPSSPSQSRPPSSLQYYNSQVDVATAYHDYAIDLCYCHRLYEDSIKSLQKAATIRECLLGKFHPDTALTYFRMASILGGSSVGTSTSSNNCRNISSRIRGSNNATSQSAGREGREHVYSFARWHAADGQRISEEINFDDDGDDNNMAARNIHNLQQALAVSRRELRITYDLLGDKKTEKFDTEEVKRKTSDERSSRKNKTVDTRQPTTNVRYHDDDEVDNDDENLEDLARLFNDSLHRSVSSVPSSSSILSFERRNERPGWLRERVQWIEEHVSKLFLSIRQTSADADVESYVNGTEIGHRTQAATERYDDSHRHDRHLEYIKPNGICFTDEEIQQLSSQYVLDLLKAMELEQVGDEETQKGEDSGNLDIALTCYNNALALESNAYGGTSNDLDIADLHVKIAKCYMRLQEKIPSTSGQQQLHERYSNVTNLTPGGLLMSSATAESNPERREPKPAARYARKQEDDHYESALVELEMAEKKYYQIFVHEDDRNDLVPLQTVNIQQRSVTTRYSSLLHEKGQSSRSLPSSMPSYKATSHACIANVLSIRGTILIRRKKFGEALAIFARVYTMTEDSFGPDHPRSQDALSDIRLVTVREQEYFRSRLSKKK